MEFSGEEVEAVPETTLGMWAYPTIFGALVLAAFGAPIPEEIPVVTAGALSAAAASRPPQPPEWTAATAALALPCSEADPVLSAAIAAESALRERTPRRHPVWYLMLPVCILGVVICDSILYAIGRIGGPHLVERPWFQKYLVKPHKRAQIEENFHKYGVRLLLGVRLLPGIRAPVFVMAGVVKLPLPRFLLADGIYAIPVVTALFFLAYWFTDTVVEFVQNFEKQVGSFKPYVILGAIAAFGLFLLYEWWKRRVVTGDPHEVPLIGERVVGPPHPDELKLDELKKDQ